MSQEKVDRYKKEKANRKQIMRKEKMANLLRKCVVGIVGLILVGWIGYSAYDLVTREDPDAEQEVVTTEMDVTALNDYLSSLSQTETE